MTIISITTGGILERRGTHPPPPSLQEGFCEENNKKTCYIASWLWGYILGTRTLRLVLVTLPHGYDSLLGSCTLFPLSSFHATIPEARSYYHIINIFL